LLDHPKTAHSYSIAICQLMTDVVSVFVFPDQKTDQRWIVHISLHVVESYLNVWVDISAPMLAAVHASALLAILVLLALTWLESIAEMLGRTMATLFAAAVKASACTRNTRHCRRVNIAGIKAILLYLCCCKERDNQCGAPWVLDECCLQAVESLRS
jgi:hypothetical protein